jgi:GNAT superfamily N-acetyltransferase
MMTAADIAFGMRLKEQAGWNQTEADWIRALDLEPEGCFLAVLDGTPVGTVTTCVFGPVAWVAMVLVEQSVRGKGIGRALMERAMQFLEDRGVQTVRLDATPLGRPLYEKLGFRVEYELTRYAGILPGADQVTGVASAGNVERESLLRLDRAVTATDRRKLLLRLFAETQEALRVVVGKEETEGFLTARIGARALQVGPCSASSSAGPLLLRDAWHRYAGQLIYIDIPAANTSAAQTVQTQGLATQRQLARMCRGSAVDENTANIWASFGPEKG